MARRTQSGNSVTRAVSAAAQVKKLHVIIGEEDKWIVVPEGTFRALRINLTKEDAISFAKQSAKKSTNGLVIVHNKHGEVESQIPIKE